jgi:Mg2+-importing ATPase
MPAPQEPAPHEDGSRRFWTLSPQDACAKLQCTPDGLSAAEAASRLQRYGANADVKPARTGPILAIARRLLEPLVLILLIAAAVSAATGDLASAGIIVAMLVLSIGLDTVQEGRALKAAEELRKSVAISAEVKRDGKLVEIPVEQVVPGDVVRVRTGDVIPADALVLEASALTANEAALTGEPYPVEKRPGSSTADSPAEASNALFRGAVVQTGEGVALVVQTGQATLFGAAASALAQAQELSPFQRDLRSLGFLIARATIALTLLVITSQILFGRPVLQSLMFAVALAVGLTPELLPMITTVTLSRGAMRLAGKKVIVKRLAAIHDLGAMTVLCTDKTGTLTSAEITLSQSLAPGGRPDPRPGRLGALSAAAGGDRGALDKALIAADPKAADACSILGRDPFDYRRRLGSVVVDGPEGRQLIAKGAPEAVLPLCAASAGGKTFGPDDRAAELKRTADLAAQGLRSVAIASRPWSKDAADPSTADETQLSFEGLAVFADPPKPGAAGAIKRLAASGVKVKILSGDDPVVVRRLAGLVGLKAEKVLTGAEIEGMSADALRVQVRRVDIYARLAPEQKSRIIHALQGGGERVGFLGDGVNDAPALKVADIGLSVDGATAVARAAADMILLDSDLGVVADGVEEGRRTFVNILKYVRMGASSNFGNMLSMAFASLFLPFLPMLPTQILLNNLLYDFSEIGIPLDSVDPKALAKPQAWDMKSLTRFAAVMGPLSSVYDLLTFAALLLVFHASAPVFRTAWFLESMATQILVIFLIRTNGRPWKDRPHPALIASSLIALAVALILPFTPIGGWFGFQAPQPHILAAITGLVAAYLACAELLKRRAIKRRARRR